MFKKICLIILIFILSENLYAQCIKDVECKGERICESGMCVYPNAENMDKVQNQSDKTKKKELKIINETELLRDQHLLSAKQALIGTILVGILSDIVAGAGLGLYYNADDPKSGKRMASYIMFGVSGALFLISMSTLGSCTSNYRKAGKYEDKIKEMKRIAFENKFITAFIPNPIIYKNGKQELYGVSFKFQF